MIQRPPQCLIETVKPVLVLGPESDLDDTLEPCLVSVCYMYLDERDVTLEPCVT